MNEPGRPAGLSYHGACFQQSAHSLAQLPSDSGAEVAFAGRSNSGKSSAINALTGARQLARTSKAPGRTQQIVLFQLDENRRLVDLPGYGYAKVPAALKKHWGNLIPAYLHSRRSLVGVVLTIDIRHLLKPMDEQMLALCQQASLPVHVLLTKADKLSKGACAATEQNMRRICENLVSTLGVQLFSVPKRLGVEQLTAVLDGWFATHPA
ncbi:MAG: ribosome biogenesis GTP-binding protein YihA/YsxC [Gammaproteobacteria bacterium]